MEAQIQSAQGEGPGVSVRTQGHRRTYLIGLGYMGLGDFTTAAQYLREVIQSDVNHQGAAVYLQMFPFLKEAIKQGMPC